ncbi:MAG TPA: hypothetical protein VMB50_04930 [Myxococcales bacterium]|nr:hypothetical protein [Myxococcales bacterium]
MHSRRLSAAALDLLLLALPWAALVGLLAVPPHTSGGGDGGAMGSLGYFIVAGGACAAACVLMLLLQEGLFLARGRTFGLAWVGLAASGGSRPLALLRWLVLGLPVAAVLLWNAPPDGWQWLRLGLLALPAAGLLGQVGCFLAPGARTLTDRIAGLRWQRDEALAPADPVRGSRAADVALLGLVAAPLAVPVLFAATETSQGLRMLVGPALAVGGVLAALLFAQSALRRRGGTLGARVFRR